MDKFREDMTTEEMVEYIRRCPKQFVQELPEKLDKWSWKLLENKTGLTKESFSGGFVTSEDTPQINSEEDKIRTEIATRILIRHAPAATINPESLADYCVEAADELLKRLKR